jgi:phenazine biosynthesis protein phzE
MSPISGTYRYPPDGVSLRGLSGFLSDEKETDELSMVLDEELKTMARICRDGGRVQGPYLRQMGHLAHTEYAIRGDTDLDVREVLRESMFAPPVVGSPLQNACRIIRRYEDSGRGYYSGVAALIGHDAAGSQTLDSAILIRTADIDTDGCIRIGVGATLVRHSQPVAEVAETAGKAAALLAALDDSVPELRPKVSAVLRRRVLAVHPRVRRLLRRRNARLSRFWLGAVAPTLELRGLRVAVVDAEDMFTAMLEHQLRSVGAWVRVYPYPEFAGAALDGCDVVVLGPGPGDPTDAADPKMSALRAVVQAVAARHMPLLGLCLGHQVLAAALDFRVAARAEPNQGVQREVDLFGIVRRVGFYNTFVACSETDVRDIPGWGPVRVAREPATGEVHALRGERVGGFQFHPESVLTEGGPHLLLAELVRLSAPALITRTAAT